jgi:hypothetical protein
MRLAVLGASGASSFACAAPADRLNQPQAQGGVVDWPEVVITLEVLAQ